MEQNSFSQLECNDLNDYKSIYDYLKNLTTYFQNLNTPKEHFTHQNIVEKIFKILTSRKFGYLGRSRSQKYYPNIMTTLRRDIEKLKPVLIYYDLGPGYHASTDPSNPSLSFSTGLGELLALGQIALFYKEVRELYSPSVFFYIVIDNLCGYATNDISIDKTLNYVSNLRQLIKDLKLGKIVSVLVESENFSIERYNSIMNKYLLNYSSLDISIADIENVSRFLGRKCDKKEAEEKISRYKIAGTVTEALLAEIIDGIRLTQRATEDTLCFRSFPGSDQRIQVGQVALTKSKKGKIMPILITDKNISDYDIIKIDTTEILPKSIPNILYAVQRFI